MLNWGALVRMAVDSILPHAEFGPNDHRKDAPRLEYVDWMKMIFGEELKSSFIFLCNGYTSADPDSYVIVPTLR